MKSLYVCYDGLLDPLGQSQVLPYLFELVKRGHTFTIISFEKEDHSAKEKQDLKRTLNDAGIQWVQLTFRFGKWALLKRIFSGIFAIRQSSRRFQPDIVHLRGFMATTLYMLSGVGLPHLYDFRGFALGEWTDIKKLKVGSLPYKLLKIIDQKAVRDAVGLVVLERAAEVLLRQTYPVSQVPLKVIRTSTNVTLYKPRTSLLSDDTSKSLRFVWLGGARSPYRPDLALKFIQNIMAHGVDCTIDFLNERDHFQIDSAASDLSFPREKMKVFKLEQSKIPQALEQYHAGLVFLDTSPWRRVCSPTKVGEYLAAGLPVIALNGIDTLTALGRDSKCALLVEGQELDSGFSSLRANNIVAFISQPGIGADCQLLARNEYSLEAAATTYSQLYQEIEGGLR